MNTSPPAVIADADTLEGLAAASLSTEQPWEASDHCSVSVPFSEGELAVALDERPDH